MFRPPPANIVTRDDPMWLDVAQPWERNAYTPTSIPIDAAQYSTEQPVRVPRWESDVLVPVGQAVGTAAFVGVVSGVLAIWLRWPWQVPAMAAATAAALIWFVTLNDLRFLLRKIETYIGKDIDGDGSVGEVVVHEYHVKDDSQTGAHWQMMISLEIDPDRLRKFAKGIVTEGQSTGTNRWTGERGLFERTEYEQLRDELISRGFARWSKSKNRGWYLTSKGTAWFTALAGELE